MPKLRDVNTTDLVGAIALGCQTMQRIFNPDDHHRPHFDARAWPPEPVDKIGFGYQSPYTEAHVPGRHLLALLAAQDLLGLDIDEQAIRNHRAAAFFSFSGALPLPLNRDHVGGPLVNFADHNLREGLFAMYALARYRQDDEARAMGERCIQAVFDLWHPRTSWDLPRLEAAGLKLIRRTFIWGPARCIGALVAFHRATGSPRALELALLLAETATAEYFRADGEFDSQRFARHTHSTTCTLSSLAQLADLTADARLMERVRVFFNRGLRRIRDDLGWVIELADLEDHNPDRGEINNTGDIMETALILGRWGYSECYADAERMIRGHLLPAQLRDTSFIVEPTSPDRPDGQRNIAQRMRGAFGFPAPYGHRPIGLPLVDFCLDIVGGGVHSLCEAFRAAVQPHASGLRVNLLFDRDHDGVRIESPYTHDALRVTVARPGPLWVRIPPWAPRASMTIDAAAATWRLHDDYAFFPAPPRGRPIVIRFDLPVHTLTLKHRTRDIRARLRGDEVIAMENHGADMTFFDPW